MSSRPGAPADAGVGTSCAFVVLAHHKPAQALRLIDRLDAPVFLHVDRGADPAAHGALLAGARERPAVTLLPRHRSGWASWGQVEPPLDGLRAARELDVAHVAVLSGQDYPLVSAAAIQAFSRRHPETSFVPHWRLPTDMWGPDGGMERLRYWHRPVRRRRVRIPVPRRLPAGLTFYGGSAYYMLTRSAIDHLLAFVAARPEVVRFYRHAWTPDEMFIHTALLNSPSATQVANENLWFMDWMPGSKHPKVFGSNGADALLAAAGRESGAGGVARAKLFARKFDADVDAAILDRLDAAAGARVP